MAVKTKAYLIIFFISALSALEVNAMAIRDIGKMCLFSGISGVITLNGEPIRQARLKRIVGKAHTEGKKEDETRTDDKGYFSMPPVYDRSVMSKILPMEFSVPQQIFVYYQGQEFKLWSGVKRQREENSESGGHPLIVSCELSNQHEMVDVGGGYVNSLCSWEFEPDNTDTGF